MKTVDAHELAARVAWSLGEVQRGEVIRVTSQGSVVAELRPASEIGELRIGDPHEPAVYRASPVRAKAGTARVLLDAERGDR
jgi:antitoxin (DNA-binding transcriptional repressor) of toxin-antitoxin stability system